VEYVVTAKKEIGRLWEQEGALYRHLFPPNLSGLRVCRMVRIYRFIDKILAATERSENGYQRRMFFRHARYLIMAFVAHQSFDILARSEFALSTGPTGDETFLSQRTNEISEVVYAQSQPLQTVKGYLSIFRNLTDLQPLADGVMQRLAGPGAQRQTDAAPIPTANATSQAPQLPLTS
jgi:hypothetical protein